MSKKRGELCENEGPDLRPADEPKRPDKTKNDVYDDDVNRPNRYPDKYRE